MKADEEDILRIDSISGLKRINQGNTAEIYMFGQKKILKLFRNGMPFNAVMREYQKVKEVQRAVNNIPKAYHIICYKNQYGIIYDYIAGTDMIHIILRHVFQINFYAKKLAHIHAHIHDKILDTGETVSSKLMNEIDVSENLSKADKDKLKNYIKSLPAGNRLCHFDFHPGNIMIEDNNTVIIDWMTACTGDPNADVARTCLLLWYGELPYGNFFIRGMTSAFKKHIGKVYYKEYKKITGALERYVEQWILPVAAARLTEWVPEREKRKLQHLIKQKLSKI